MTKHAVNEQPPGEVLRGASFATLEGSAITPAAKKLIDTLNERVIAQVALHEAASAAPGSEVGRADDARADRHHAGIEPPPGLRVRFGTESAVKGITKPEVRNSKTQENPDLTPGAVEDHYPGRLNEKLRWDWIDLRSFR